jgi:hypothetical protein
LGTGIQGLHQQGLFPSKVQQQKANDSIAFQFSGTAKDYIQALVLPNCTASFHGIFLACMHAGAQGFRGAAPMHG